jgi:hypothetical protein
MLLLVLLCLQLVMCLLQLQVQLVLQVPTGCHSRQGLSAELQSEDTIDCIKVTFSCLNCARRSCRVLAAQAAVGCRVLAWDFAYETG